MFISKFRLTGPVRALRFGAWLVAGALVAGCAGVSNHPAVDVTRVYFVRHGEIIKDDPSRQLSDKGHARAKTLVKHFQGVPITHIYASHTDRTRDTVAPLAQERGLSVRQLPAVGTQIDGKVVDNSTSGAAAIKPLIAALRSVPAGSSVVVAGNAGNLYAVMAGIRSECRLELHAGEQGLHPLCGKGVFPPR